jgi:hypothetical protein
MRLTLGAIIAFARGGGGSVKEEFALVLPLPSGGEGRPSVMSRKSAERLAHRGFGRSVTRTRIVLLTDWGPTADTEPNAAPTDTPR